MVKLRLRRMGRKQAPVYDIVAADGRSPRDGRFIEKVGQYNPTAAGNPITILKRDRVLHWLNNGAQPTDTVRALLRREGVIMERYLSRKGVAADAVAQAVEAHVDRKRTVDERNARKAADAVAAKARAEAEAAAAAEADAKAKAEAEAAEARAQAEAEAAAAAAPEEAPAAADATAAETPTEQEVTGEKSTEENAS